MESGMEKKFSCRLVNSSLTKFLEIYDNAWGDWNLVRDGAQRICGSIIASRGNYLCFLEISCNSEGTRPYLGVDNTTGECS